MAHDHDHSHDDIPTEVLAETENYAAWVSNEPDGETIYHIELGAVTVHLFEEDWKELIALIQAVSKKK